MKRKHSQALAALSHLLQADFKTATRKQRVTAEAAVRARPSVWTLILAMKDWARALADVCRSHSQKCSEIHEDCNEQDPATAAMKTILLVLCDHLWLPADPLSLLTDVWPESNALREFVLEVSGAPVELIDGEIVQKTTLPRWKPKSRGPFGRRLAGLDPDAPQGQNAAFLSVDETQKVLRGLEESFRNALWDSLKTSYSEAVLASYRAPAPKPQIPPKKQDCSKYFDSAGLTDRQREVLSLQLEHEMTLHQIAQHLGRHHSTIQEHIRAGRARLDQAAQHVKRKGHAARHGVD